MGRVPNALPDYTAPTPSTDPGPLTNSMSSTTTNGVLVDIAGIGTVNEANVETNLSELVVKYEALRQVLLEQGLIA